MIDVDPRLGSVVLLALVFLLIVMPLTCFALWRKGTGWKAVPGVALVYLLLATLLGLWVYQTVPSQFVSDKSLDWSWPPASDSLGTHHGKYLAIAAGTGSTVPGWVREEQTEYFRKWLGATVVGMVPVMMLVLAWNLFRRLRFKDGRNSFRTG